MSDKLDIFTEGVFFGLKQAVEIMELKGNTLEFNLRMVKNYKNSISTRTDIAELKRNL